MAARVRLMLKDRQIDEVPLGDTPIRIGRMKENDLVVNNLAVSRFHATLGREDDAFFLEDTGSENGTWVNGERIQRQAVTGDDEIRVGKHQLVLVTDADSDAEVATLAAASSDPWDAANTYFRGQRDPRVDARRRGRHRSLDGDGGRGCWKTTMATSSKRRPHPSSA